MAVTMILISVIIIVMIGLQIFLSKMQHKWLGLVLPLLLLSYSIFIVIEMAMVGDVNWSKKAFGITSTFVEYNIPTLALYIVYKIYHKNKQKK